nr:MAG TPA: hypothetical protein [Caudoviricetes sp.]
MLKIRKNWPFWAVLTRFLENFYVKTSLFY